MKINLTKTITDFIFNPKKKWSQIIIEDYSRKEITTRFLMPIIVISSFTKLIGRYINLRDFSIINSVLSFVAFIFIAFVIIYASSYILNQLLPKFNLRKDLDSIFKLISFSSFPAIIASAISDLHPVFSFLNLISIYSVILFWIGSNVILQLPKEKSTGFVLISLIIVAVSLFIVSFIVMTIFLSIFFNL